jgi:hypothetical protein
VTLPHWDWLHGPADSPDPRVGERSASAAHQDRPSQPGTAWDYWLHQPVREFREESA